MSQEIAIPDYLKDMMADGTVVNTVQEMDVASGGVPRLTTKGKVFRFKEGEDEEKVGQEVKGIIVGMNPPIGLSHTFYREGYTPDSNSPPDCSSSNGQEPDNWIQNPEHTQCIKCPQQVWGSAVSMSGGKAKACKDTKQLFIAKAADFAKDPENCTLWLLSVTINSLKNFSTYGKVLAKAGVPGPEFVITEISFDEEASVPKLEFKMLGILNEKLGKVAYKRSDAKEWDSGLSLPRPPAKSDKGAPRLSEPKPETKAEPIQEDLDELIGNW